jgi:hypothetical protein
VVLALSVARVALALSLSVMQIPLQQLLQPQAHLP